MGRERLELGRRWEKVAARELVRLGYKIVACNARGVFGEIDIIAQKGGVLYVVEVRSRRFGCGIGNAGSGSTRSGHGFHEDEFSPVESIRRRKLLHLHRAGVDFLKKNGMENLDVNILLIAVVWERGNIPKFECVPVY